MGFLGEPTHWILILVLLLVLFGAKRLPELGKGLGEGMKSFKEGLKGVTETPAPPMQRQVATPAPPPAPASPAAAAGRPAMEYVTCGRCGGKFENPFGFKVDNYVCQSCQQRA